ncbi:MAG: phosphomannomutase/phosphoglucomutase, partial [Phycisphaerae bacterium]|nr:phosphomannomutase/phosphoglucomutase [Phycisphaerae bacterium]
MSVLDNVFKAYDVRGLYGEQIDEDLAWRVGHAAAQFLRTRLSGYERGQSSINKIVVGRDMRPHGEPLAKALIEGISSSGAHCIDVGMIDTPLIYFAINHLGACGGIQVTASHNPIEYNGFKISGYHAKPVGQNTGLDEIKHIASTVKRMPSSAAMAPIQKVDLWDEYRKHVLQFVKLERPLKVAVDASNGMAGKMIPTVFSDMENLEIIPLNFERGQGFVHPPNPLVEANMKWARDAVKESGAELGICLDGDADRCMFVDEQGEIVRCDIMAALLAQDFLQDNPGSTVVFDLRSSRALAEAIRDAGGVPRKERVGHAFMKKAMADTNAIFGGELSGHYYFRDNFCADSAAIVFAKAISVLSTASKPVSELVAPFQTYHHSGEINFQVDNKEARMKDVEEHFPGGEVDHLDGVSVNFEDWWLNVRPSNTEPLLRLSCECRTEAMLNEKLDKIKAILG